MTKAIGYTVTDRQTGKVIKTYGEGKRSSASRFADKKDMEYGAIRYIVNPIWSDEA